jgi:hypothetical protein
MTHGEAGIRKPVNCIRLSLLIVKHVPVFLTAYNIERTVA